jgi:hypothetical protein
MRTVLAARPCRIGRKAVIVSFANRATQRFAREGKSKFGRASA